MTATGKTTLNTSRLFSPGQIVAAHGEFVAWQLPQLDRCLYRHSGCVDKQDANANDAAVKSGDRILSAYLIDDSKPCNGAGCNTLWIITEADRSVTTFLLPAECRELSDAPKELTLF